MPRKAEDLTGKKFNFLTVVERDFNHSAKGVFWKCICDCGTERVVRSDRLKNGETKSCGCYSTNKLIEYNKNIKANDLTNQIFGKWKVLQKTDKRESGSIVWLCQCECGTIKEIRGTSLIAGETKSCGCIQYKDITDQRFGKLIALKEVKKGSLENPSQWFCKCDCGNTKIINKKDLLRGHTSSCGLCLKTSLGEEKISQLLKEHQISFEKEKTFESCRFPDTNALARFDFYINNKYLIEFDGKQHYIKDSGYGADLENTQRRDKFKNEWCKKNNIPLIRIPYTHLNEICLEDLLLETSKFLII